MQIALLYFWFGISFPISCWCALLLPTPQHQQGRNQKAYDAAAKGFNDQQRAIGEGLLQVVRSPRIIEAKFYSDANVNFKRNPQIAKTTFQADPDMNNMKAAVTTYEPMFKGQGLIVQTVQEAMTFSLQDPNDQTGTRREIELLF